MSHKKRSEEISIEFCKGSVFDSQKAAMLQPKEGATVRLRGSKQRDAKVWGRRSQ
jgi:hypothetical protein